MSTKKIEDSKPEQQYLTKEDVHGFQKATYLETEEDNWHKSVWMVKLRDRFVVVQREGKCESKKCKSACCKFCSSGYLKEYARGFFEEDEFGCDITRITCNHLTKDGKCRKWGKNLPKACQQFPHPSDSIYWNVMDKCTFRFKILYEIELTGDIVREEMLKNSEEQLL